MPVGPASATMCVLRSFLKEASVSVRVSRSFNFWKDLRWASSHINCWSFLVRILRGSATGKNLQSQTKIVGTLPSNAVFFFSLLARLLVLPMLFIAVNSANLVHQHWVGKTTAKCPNNFDCETFGRNILKQYSFVHTNTG